MQNPAWLPGTTTYNLVTNNGQLCLTNYFNLLAAGSRWMKAYDASDPLNLVGIATPGDRVPALAGNRILYRDGEPIAILEGKETRFLVDLDPATRWQAQNALVRRAVAPRLKEYLGRSA